jgi:hypothetical protein
VSRVSRGGILDQRWGGGGARSREPGLYFDPRGEMSRIKPHVGGTGE